jgi:hypothetical protein
VRFRKDVQEGPVAKISFNLSKSSLPPGWDPLDPAHDALWQQFATGYEYNLVGQSTQYDSLRSSDPATGGVSDTFSSSVGSLDLTAHNFTGHVSLDWHGEVAELSLDSAWNTIKNISVTDFSAHELVLRNWVDTWVALDNNFGQEIFVDGAKRAEISTGSGNDTIWVGVDSNAADWSNHIKVDAGVGNDHITVAESTKDYSGSSFAAAYNPAWTTTELKGGAGYDTIEGGRMSDTIDGGADTDTVVLHGLRTDYNISTNAVGVTTVVDLRPSATNLDGTDHLTNVEFLQFSDHTTLGLQQITSPDEFGLHTAHQAPVGSTVTVTLVLPDLAPPGGETVVLSASPSSWVALPASLLLVEGQSTATFQVTDNAAGDVAISASVGGASYSTDIDFTDSTPSAVARTDIPIAFTGLNTDGDNDIAFVAMANIAGDRTIEFGGASINSTDHWTWTPPAAGVTAGTVIRIDHIHSQGGITTDIGTVTGSGDLSGQNEAVFAFTSEITPNGLERNYIAAISNSTFQAAGSDLASVGLTVGENALEFGSHVDIATYTGPRSDLPNGTTADYLAHLMSTANWISQSGSGDQSHDSVAPDIPFSPIRFDLHV